LLLYVGRSLCGCREKAVERASRHEVEEWTFDASCPDFPKSDFEVTVAWWLVVHTVVAYLSLLLLLSEVVVAVLSG
jgi:hypothetical protein